MVAEAAGMVVVAAGMAMLLFNRSSASLFQPSEMWTQYGCKAKGRQDGSMSVPFLVGCAKSHRQWMSKILHHFLNLHPLAPPYIILSAWLVYRRPGMRRHPDARRAVPKGNNIIWEGEGGLE